MALGPCPRRLGPLRPEPGGCPELPEACSGWGRPSPDLRSASGRPAWWAEGHLCVAVRASLCLFLHQGLDRVLGGLRSSWGGVAGTGQRTPAGALRPRRAASSARGGVPRIPCLLGPSWAHRAPGSCPSCRLGLLSAFESVSSPRLCELSFKPEMGSFALLRGLKE